MGIVRTWSSVCDDDARVIDRGEQKMGHCKTLRVKTHIDDECGFGIGSGR